MMENEKMEEILKDLMKFDNKKDIEKLIKIKNDNTETLERRTAAITILQSSTFAKKYL